MKILLSALMVVVALASVAQAAFMSSSEEIEWTQDHVESYFGPHNAYRVTIESDNGVVSVIDVPEGVLLSIVASEYGARESGDSSQIPRLFRGDMTIRARRNDEVREGESSMASDLMAKAPLEVKLHGVVVSVEMVQ